MGMCSQREFYISLAEQKQKQKAFAVALSVPMIGEGSEEKFVAL